MRLSELINEKLTPSQYRKYVKGFFKDRYETIFNEYKQSWQRNSYRIYIPITSDQTLIKSVASDKIKSYLQNKKIEIQDYQKGYGKDDKGRVIRIGRVLASDPELKKQFDNDPTRKLIKNKNYYAIISRHPYDIAGMSTDRGWTSCMDLDDGINKQHIFDDIKEGTLIAYFVREDDKNINNPIGRVLIKPFLNQNPNISSKSKDNFILKRSQKTYGTIIPEFLKTIDKWLDKINSEKSGLFVLAGSLYPEMEYPTVLHNITNDETKFKEWIETEFNIHDISDIKNARLSKDEIQFIYDNLPDDKKYRMLNVYFINKNIKMKPEDIFRDIDAFIKSDSIEMYKQLPPNAIKEWQVIYNNISYVINNIDYFYNRFIKDFPDNVKFKLLGETMNIIKYINVKDIPLDILDFLVELNFNGLKNSIKFKDQLTEEQRKFIINKEPSYITELTNVSFDEFVIGLTSDQLNRHTAESIIKYFKNSSKEHQLRLNELLKYNIKYAYFSDDKKLITKMLLKYPDTLNEIEVNSPLMLKEDISIFYPIVFKADPLMVFYDRDTIEYSKTHDTVDTSTDDGKFIEYIINFIYPIKRKSVYLSDENVSIIVESDVRNEYKKQMDTIKKLSEKTTFDVKFIDVLLEQKIFIMRNK